MTTHLSLAWLRGATVALLAGALAAACTFGPAPQEATPTVVAASTPSPSPTAAPSPTLDATPVPATAPPLVEPSATPLPPSETATPTETPGPHEHTLQSGETLLYIVQLYGHRDPAVVSQVVRLNNLLNADRLPGAGAVLLIPRPTPSPTPDATEGPAGGQAVALLQPRSTAIGMSAGAAVGQHTVREGESMVTIAQQYSTTLEILAQLNFPEISFAGCDFNNPSGGPSCNVSLQIGQPVNIPLPTPTPTLSPTPSGNETATPMPTYSPPRAVYPPEGAVARGGIVTLQWVSVGVLQPGEVYLVIVRDLTANTEHADVTRATALTLPQDLIPQGGAAHDIAWTVAVARQNDAGRYAMVGAPPPVQRFRWQG